MDGRVTWTEFLDYFAGVSLAIDDEDFFELTMRNAIKVRACVRDCARVCVWCACFNTCLLFLQPSGSPAKAHFADTYAKARRVKVITYLRMPICI